jgi:hypothetical protein
MITGSRLGASFIVLFVGFLYNLRGQRRIASVSIGVTALIVTATIYLPALALGYAILSQGWLDGVHIGPSTELNSVISTIFDPLVGLAAYFLPAWALFIWASALLVAFRIFDQALPRSTPNAPASSASPTWCIAPR